MPKFKVTLPTHDTDGRPLDAVGVKFRAFDPQGQVVKEQEPFGMMPAGSEVTYFMAMNADEAQRSSGGSGDARAFAPGLALSEPATTPAPAVVNPTAPLPPTGFTYENS